MSTSEALKIERERRKAIEQAQRWALLQSLIRSPLVQLVGTVAVAEYLEHERILSSRWAGALEGGVIAMVGLQALKEYGILGAAGLGLGVAGGSTIGGMKDWSAADWGKFIGASSVNPYLGVAQMLGITGM